MFKWHERKENEPGGKVSLVYILREDSGSIFCHIGVYSVEHPPDMKLLLEEMEVSAKMNGLEVMSWQSQLLGS